MCRRRSDSSPVPVALFAAVLIVSFALGTASFAAERPPGPVAVSPGAPAGALIDTPCPTFNWSADARANGYELVLYRLRPDRGEPVLVLRKTIHGSALGWTPPLGQCLERGGRYAWSVRALAADRTSDWSAPHLFEVTAAPSERELTAALDVVQRYLAAGERPRTAPGAAGSGEAEAVPAREHDAPTSTAPQRTASAATAPTLMSVAGNVDATSFSGDGSALLNLDWGNLQNVPAGFADGTDDGIVYAAGDQLTLNATTFNVVEGAGSGLDADLLDGQHGAAFAAQATTYTKTEVDALLTVDNIDAPIPAAPTHLRVGPEPGAPGKRRLSWNMPSLTGVALFTVYQADFAIDDLNKASAHRQVTGTLHAAVDLLPGSGVQHFRVEAQNVLGDAGQLSTELVIDTTSRLAYRADERFDNLYELFVAPGSGGGSTVVGFTSPSVSEDVMDYAWSPNGTALAFRSTHSGNTELYVVPATGGTPARINGTLLSGTVGSDYAWSPDGAELAYIAAQDTVSVSELYVAPASGGASRKINPPLVSGIVRTFAWSPDGSRLAYIADQDTPNVLELYVAPATGGSSTKVNGALVSGGDVAGASGTTPFAWAPDGASLAYRADQVTDEVYELWVAPATGGSFTKINPALVTGGDVFDFAWAPDGTRIAYLADLAVDGQLNLYATPPSGGASIQVNDPLASGYWIYGFTWTWSSDGSRLLFQVNQGSSPTEIYSAPAVGGGTSKVNGTLLAGNVSVFGWSPDGQRIGYVAAQSSANTSDLYVTTATGGSWTRINPALPSGRGISEFAWAPDGTRLAYLANPGLSSLVFDLFEAPVTGGRATKINGPLVSGRIVTDFAWAPLGAP